MSEGLGPGSTFAGCRIEAVAGQGGMGVVYRATQLTLGRLVAVKAIAPGLGQDASYRERFKRESRLAAMIDHPNILPVYEAGESNGTLFLIMRWVEGTDLRAIISAGRLEPARAVRLLRPVASALAAAHKQGLVHRDVKPANVLIAPGSDVREEHVYLTDFGIARRSVAESPITQTGMFLGTVDYTAPERFIGGKGDAVSDIYSFGCMLFEALTARVPYQAPNEAAKAFAHVRDPVPSVREFAPEIPARLDAVVARAMAKNPKERFASAGELTRALDQALGEPAAEDPMVPPETAAPSRAEVGSPTVTSPTEARPPADGPASKETTIGAPVPRRRRIWMWAAAVALLGGLAAAAVIVLGTGGAGRKATPSEIRTVSPGLAKLQTISLGGVPGGMAIGQLGEVWVSLPDSGAVARVGADGVLTKFAVGGRPGQIAVGPAGVWLSGSSFGALVRLDAQTGRPVATASVSSPPTALTVDRDDGSAWVADSTGSVVHVDPTGTVSGQPARVAPPVLGLGWGEGWVWAVNGTGTGLVRVSLDGSGATRPFDTHPGPVSVTFNQGVWTAHFGGDVTRFDPRPNFLRVNTDVAVARSLGQISAIEAQPSVWAISGQSQTLYRISTQPSAPVTGTAVLASSPVGLAVGESSVWVATEDGNLTQIGS